MELKIGMTIQASSIQGDLIQGSVEKINERTLILRSKNDSQLYLVRLDSLDASIIIKKKRKITFN